MKYSDFDAIKRAYPAVVSIDETHGCFDKDNKAVTVEQSKIDTARTTLNTEAAAIKYKTDRTRNGSAIYADFGEQLDMLYKDMVAGKLDTSGTWAAHIAAVKGGNPKP